MRESDPSPELYLGQSYSRLDQQPLELPPGDQRSHRHRFLALFRAQIAAV
jgi:hypothetical protein